MSELLTMFVPGRPRPQGSKRIVRGRLIESSRGLRQWRRDIAMTALATRSARRSWPRLGPVAVRADFLLSGRLDVRPDLDKLCRALLDGLVEAGIIADDGQVVRLTAEKLPETGAEGVFVEVRGVEP